MKDTHQPPNHSQKDFRKEHRPDQPLRCLLSPAQIEHLADIGKKASNAIYSQAGKVIESHAEMRSKKNEARTEDSFFTEKENPNYLTLFELCTSSEHSGLVQRKLSKLKEHERIELFYLMKPYLLRLALDGLGKYVIHGLISMSKLLLTKT